MTIEDKMKDFTAKLDRQVETHRAEQAHAHTELVALFRQAEVRQQTQIRQQRTTARTQFHWQPASTPQHGRVSMAKTGLLQQLDELMWADFKLGRQFPIQRMNRYPVVYCESLTEFFAPLLAAEGLSETERQKQLQQEITEAEQQARDAGGGIFGVNLPGRGCYLNGWLFGAVNNLPAPAALRDGQIFPRILKTACHEKLGHGFIAELTAVGQEKSQVGLWRFDLARTFARRTVDTPHGTLLRAKHGLLYHTTKFTEEGWATWIEQFVLWRAAQTGLLPGMEAGPQPEIRYKLDAVANLWENLYNQVEDEIRPIIERLMQATQILLVESDSPPSAKILAAIRIWQNEAHYFDELFSEVFRQPSVYVLGYLLMRRLETRLGWANLPLAVALAANLTYDLETMSVADLESLAANDPRLNVDARLALLGTLDLSPRFDRAELLRQAREQLNLAIPDGWNQ